MKRSRGWGEKDRRVGIAPPPSLERRNQEDIRRSLIYDGGDIITTLFFRVPGRQKYRESEKDANITRVEGDSIVRSRGLISPCGGEGGGRTG